MLKDYFEVPNKPAIKSGNVLSCDFTDHETFIPQPLDFTRNTLATYVDCNGFIKYSGITNNELVINGNFDTDTDWNLTSNAVIANGFVKLDSTFGVSYSRCRQNNAAIINLVEITFTIKSNNGIGVMQIRNYGGGNTTNISSLDVGTHTVYINYSSQGISFQASSGRIIEIDNVSVKQIDLNTPRIDYLTEIGKAKELQKPSLLLEPQSTNLFPKSNDVDATAANKLENQITSPEGLQNAALYVENTATASHGAIKSGIFPTAGATTYTLSVFAKAKERHLLRLNLYADGTSNLTDNFDLINGTVSDANSTIEDFGNGWFRCSTTKTVTNSGGYNFAAVYMGKATNTYYYEGDGTSGLYLFGFQVEQQNHATSYIPTSGSTVTRNREVCNNAGQLGVFNSKEGVLYAEIARTSDNANYELMAISDGNPNYQNLVALGFDANNNEIWYRAKLGNTDLIIVSAGAPIAPQNEFIKIAVKYKSGDSKVYLNGVLIDSTTTTASTSVEFTTFDFNFVNIYPFYGKIREIKAFRRALTDTELIELTNNIT